MERPVFKRVVPVVPTGEAFDEVVKFYEGTLGFERVWVGGGYAGMRCGEAEILLQRFGDEAFRTSYVFRVQVADVDAYYARLKEIGVGRLGKLEVKPWGTYEFHLIDPAGVLIQFFR